MNWNWILFEGKCSWSFSLGFSVDSFRFQSAGCVSTRRPRNSMKEHFRFNGNAFAPLFDSSILVWRATNRWSEHWNDFYELIKRWDWVRGGCRADFECVFSVNVLENSILLEVIDSLRLLVLEFTGNVDYLEWNAIQGTRITFNGELIGELKTILPIAFTSSTIIHRMSDSFWGNVRWKKKHK